MRFPNETVSVLRDYPFPVNFAGLRSDLRTLSENGWEIRVEAGKDYYSRETGESVLTFFLRHDRLNLEAYSRRWGVSFENLMNQSIYSKPIEIERFAEEIFIRAASPGRWGVVNYASMELDFTKTTEHIIAPRDLFMGIQDIPIFSKRGGDANIYVPKEEIWTVEKHLSAIREMQAPKQKEIKAMLRKRDKGAKEIQEKVQFKLISC